MIIQCKFPPQPKDSSRLICKLCSGSFKSIFAMEKHFCLTKYNFGFSRHSAKHNAGSWFQSFTKQGKVHSYPSCVWVWPGSLWTFESNKAGYTATPVLCGYDRAHSGLSKIKEHCQALFIFQPEKLMRSTHTRHGMRLIKEHLYKLL